MSEYFSKIDWEDVIDPEFDDNVPVTVYTRIKELREYYGVSQASMAKLLKVTQQGYSAKEKVFTRFEFMDIVIIAYAFNVSFDFLLGVTDDLKPLNNGTWEINGFKLEKEKTKN